MISGRNRSSPVIALFGYMICGKVQRTALAMSEAMNATAIASHTTLACGRSALLSACARPRLRPSVASNAASSTTTTAIANRPTRSGP